MPMNRWTSPHSHPSGQRPKTAGTTYNFEDAALRCSRELDRAIQAAQFELAASIVSQLCLAAIDGKVRSMDVLGQEPKGKLFTALLRAGQTKPSSEPAVEAARHGLEAHLSEAWRILGDDRRARSAAARAGSARAPEYLRADTGDVLAQAALLAHRANEGEAISLLSKHGYLSEAATLAEAIGNWPVAARLFLSGRDLMRAASCIAKSPLGELFQVPPESIDSLCANLEAAGALSPKAALLQAAGRMVDAAAAWERAGQPGKAGECQLAIRNTEQANRLFRAAATSAKSSGDEDAARAWLARVELPKASTKVPSAGPRGRAAANELLQKFEEAMSERRYGEAAQIAQKALRMAALKREWAELDGWRQRESAALAKSKSAPRASPALEPSQCHGTVIVDSRFKQIGYIRSDTTSETVKFRTQDCLGGGPLTVGSQVSYVVESTSNGLRAVKVLLRAPGVPPPAEEAPQADPRSGVLAQAILARDARRYDEARRLYEQGLRECPSTVLVTSYTAMEKGLRQFGSAMRVYEKGMALYPQNAKLREEAGLLASQMGDSERAIQLLHEALTLVRQRKQGGEKGILLALARTYYRRETAVDLRRCVQVYSEAQGLFAPSSRMQADDLKRWTLARIRIQHHRGDLSARWIQDLKLQIESARLFDANTEGADFVLRTADAELIEGFGLTGRFLLRVSFKNEVTHQDIASLDEALRVAADEQRIDEPLALFVVASLAPDIQAHLFKRIEDRRVASPTIVPLPQAVLETSAARESLQSTLNLWLFRRDLFAVNSPVVGKRFFGRTRQLAELRESITNSVPTGVFGLRKVGKTSLLKEQARRAEVAGHLVVYVDLLRVPAEVSDCRWLYWTIATRLLESLKPLARPDDRWRLAGRFLDFLEIPADFPVSIAFDADLRTALEVLRRSPRTTEPRIAILLDEIERLLPTSLGKQGFTGFFDFFGYMRGLCQECREFVVVVTGANAAITEIAQFEGRDNPVFNFFAEMYLPFLEPSECSVMMRELGRGMGMRFKDEAVSAIHKLTGGHPFFARQFGSFLSDHHKQRPLTVDEGLVQQASRPYLEIVSKDLREILERLARDFPRELEICQALAQAGGRLSLDQIREQHRGDVQIRHLVGYQIIRLDGSHAFLSMDLLTQWLRQSLGT